METNEFKKKYNEIKMVTDLELLVIKLSRDQRKSLLSALILVKEYSGITMKDERLVFALQLSLIE